MVHDGCGLSEMGEGVVDRLYSYVVHGWNSCMVCMGFRRFGKMPINFRRTIPLRHTNRPTTLANSGL